MKRPRSGRTFVFLSILLAFILIQSVPIPIGASIAPSQWTPPPTDNTWYSEDLDVRVTKDGSVVNSWSLVDNGIGNISMPIDLEVPFNDSSDAIIDCRVRVAAVENSPRKQEWGAITIQDMNYEFAYDGPTSLVSHVYLEIYARVNESAYLNEARNIMVNYSTAFEIAFPGIDLLLMSESYSGGNTIVTLRYYGFPDVGVLRNFFSALLDNNLPTGIGLFNPNRDVFLKAPFKSIHIVANWDNEFTDSYAQEPSIGGGIEDEDQRWEYIAGICQGRERVINIKSNAVNSLLLKDVLPYTTELPSHPNANASNLQVTLFHGCEIVQAKPNFNVARARATYWIDMLSDSGEGANYRLPETAHVNFTAGMKEAPVLHLDLSADDYLVENGQNITLTYTITNVGGVTAYNVELEDDLNNPGPAWSIVAGDSDSDNDINKTWTQIQPGQTVMHVGKVQCTVGSSSNIVCDPELRYHASTYADTSEWLRNPWDPYGGYFLQGEGQYLACNANSSIISTHTNISDYSVEAGDEVDITMVLTNEGNLTASDIGWMFPSLGINTTVMSGTISSLSPGESITLNGSFIIEPYSRFMGDYIEPRFWTDYGAGMIGYAPYSGYGIFGCGQLPLNIFPTINKKYGPLLQVWREQSLVTVEGINYASVTVHVKNIGDMPAYNVDSNDMIPFENYTVVAGSTSIPGGASWDLLLPGIEFSYAYVMEVPAGFPASKKVNLLLVDYGLRRSGGFFDGEIYSSEFTFDVAIPIEGIDPGLFWGMTIGFIAVTAVAVILFLALLDEKGVVKLRR